MRTFAERLRDDINKNSEISRLESKFRHDPSGSFETTLDYSTAKELGFEVYSTQRDGVYVSLPKNNYGQFGDH